MPPSNQSFRLLYEQYSDLVFNLCLNYLQNEADAEEVTQDVFLKVYQNIDHFRDDSSLKTWIYRIGINKCLDFLKAKKRRKRFGILLPLFSGPTSETLKAGSDFRHPGIQLEDQEALQQLFKHINDLPEKQKSALILKAIDGLSQKEIAGILKTTEKAVESLLSRARKNLQKKIDQSEGKN
ncbi:MAG: RNA polymerase sigma factor [Bacteroidetes bacterium]|nr:RNA polymerase sigma factor [Bacteroidota bacterium]